MSAVQEAITYCLKRYIDQTRRLGIPGTNVINRNQHPDQLKRFDPKEGSEEVAEATGEPEAEPEAAE